MIPTEYIVAQGNAFFLLHGTVMAAPIATRPDGQIQWIEMVEVERQDLEDTTVVDAITLALRTITV